MYIEDIVTTIANDDQRLSKVSVKDANLFKNIDRQLKNGIYLTEGQANLLVKVLKQNFFTLSITDLASSLDFPKFKHKFRTIDTVKKIFLYDNNTIGIKYPFNNKLTNLINSIVGGRYIEFFKKDKIYIVPLTTKNIFGLVSSLKSFDFTIDQTLLDWYAEIEKIKVNAESHIPLIDHTDRLTLFNINQTTLDYYQSNSSPQLIPNLFLAKSLGLEISNAAKQKIKPEEANNLTKAILISDKHRFFLTSKKYHISNIVSSIKELQCWPIMVILEDNNLSSLENWFIDLTNQGIDAKQMSVLFRSTNNKDINNFIKLKQINNLVDDNTKVVFVKQKIPKLLFKIPFKPKLLICSTRFYAHYTAAKMVDSHPFVLYYVDQVSNLGNEIAEL
jgi:hypothetical protein